MSIAHHNTRIFYWATLLGSVNFLEPVMALFYLHRGLSPTQIFFTLTAYSAVNLIFEVPTGAFADRYGPKAAFLVGGLIGLVSMLLLLVTKSNWALFASNSLWALGWSFFSGADEAVIYESLKESGEEGRMGAVLGKIISAGFIPMTLSYLVGPYLARDLTESQFMLLIALTSVFVAGKFVLITQVRTPQAFERYRVNPYAHMKNAVGVLRGNPDLLLLFLNATLVFIPTYVFARFDPPYLAGAGLPAPYLGAMYAAGAAVSWFLAKNVGSITTRFPRIPVVLWSGVAVFLALGAAALFQQTLIVASFAFFLVRIGRTIRNPILGHMQNEYIPSGSRSTTLSLLSVLDSLADVIVVPAMSMLAAFGLPSIFTACAGVALAGLLFPVRQAPVPARESPGNSS